MNFNFYLRKLAKSIISQNLFTAAKDIGNIKLFNNCADFSKIQQEYLSYLYTYNNIYQEIYSKEVSEKVLDEDIYTDAFLYYKSKKKDKPDKEHTGKQRKIQATFAKDNTKIKFSKEVK